MRVSGAGVAFRLRCFGGHGFWCIRSPEMQRWLLPGELEERMQVRDARVKRRNVAQDGGMDGRTDGRMDGWTDDSPPRHRWRVRGRPGRLRHRRRP